MQSSNTNSNTNIPDNGGVHSAKIHRNPSMDELYNILIQSGQATETNTGALVISTGKFTGRSPKDKFIVKDDSTCDLVAWGGFNNPFDSEQFDRLHEKMVRYFEKEEYYVRDVYACSDVRYRTKIRIVAEKAWSCLFAYNMFIRPSEEEFKRFEPEWTVYCAPSFQADPDKDGTRQENFSIIDFTRKILLIGGSGFTGEIKKGMFTVLNLILPHKHNVLSMHCAANIGKKGDTALFFGLSGTGKTTLSADPHRKLIGDDEHGWTLDDTIFNVEGGCYAKTLNITREKEPDIFDAIKKGALLENVCNREGTNEVDYADSTKTENTRVSYPIHHIRSVAQPTIGAQPQNIFFLTCDAYGVLPPISKLTPGQVAFHFISGYTAKIPGTEAGVITPTTTFSACFSAPFIPLHPTKYAEMLMARMKSAKAAAWLVNTGWSGGAYGVGKRMPLEYTRTLIRAAIDGTLDNIPYITQDIFGLSIPVSCPGVPDVILNPKNTWQDKQAYDVQAHELALQFNENFKKFSSFANEEILSGAPKIK